jgi:hypothetical protein
LLALPSWHALLQLLLGLELLGHCIGRLLGHNTACMLQKHVRPEGNNDASCTRIVPSGHGLPRV